jgi:pilus assembly protein CpaF
MISRALDIIVQTDRLADGTRRILALTEITGMEGNVITTQDIFVFNQTGVGDDGRIQGSFQATGVRPKFMSRLQRNGIEIPREYFRYKMDV